MKTAILSILAIMAGVSMAIDRAPAVMVSTSTNNYGVLTGQTAQADFDFIDDWLIAESNRLTSVSNLAQSAYDTATGLTTGVHRAYFFANTGTWSVASVTSGQAWCYASTQSIGMIHANMAVSGSVFAAGTTVSSVDYGSRLVSLTLATTNSGAGVSCSFWGGGTYTHTVPSGFSRSKVTVVGGGGGGGDRAGTDSGGGGGGACIGYWNLIAGTAYTVTVGAGGAGAAGAGTNGSSSSFGSLQTATGGDGASAAGSNGAVGGFGTGGTVNFYGNAGDSSGGGSYFGGGGSILGTSTNRAGRLYGGGGGGNGGGTGGAGHFGCVLVEYY